MRVIGCILGGMIFACTPAAAQRFQPGYPVCIQRWEWGGSSYIDCSFSSWQQCQAAALGLAGMCLLNPYASPPAASRAPARR